MPERIINFDDQHERNRFIEAAHKMRGKKRVAIVNYRPRRSDMQNMYYWPCIIVPFKNWLKEQGHESVTEDVAHEMLKTKFLKKELIDEKTGEVVGEYVQSTATMDFVDFWDYVEQCVRFLGEFCDIYVPPPDKNWKLKQQKGKR